MKRIVPIILFLLATASAGLASTLVKQVNIEQLTADAQRIFLGKCLSVGSLRDEHGLPATIYTFAVEQNLKGRPGRQVAVKQLGATAGLPDGSVLRVAGMPEYHVGETYLLFLTPESELGFSSPQGLGQGAFRTFRDPETRRLAVENGSKNRTLFTNLRRESSVQARTAASGSGESKPLFLDDLLTLVTKLLNK